MTTRAQAPKGGVTIGSVFYKGGQFLPDWMPIEYPSRKKSSLVQNHHPVTVKKYSAIITNIVGQVDPELPINQCGNQEQPIDKPALSRFQELELQVEKTLKDDIYKTYNELVVRMPSSLLRNVTCATTRERSIRQNSRWTYVKQLENEICYVIYQR